MCLCRLRCASSLCENKVTRNNSTWWVGQKFCKKEAGWKVEPLVEPLVATDPLAARTHAAAEGVGERSVWGHAVTG